MTAFQKRSQGTIFEGIMPELLPEIDMRRLILLGAMVRKKKRIELYTPLLDCLRKIQWVKFCGLKAISIENEISAKMGPNVLIMYPMGMVEHSLNITDCLIHTKSALDSMATFLTSLFRFKIKTEKRDFRYASYQSKIKQKDAMLWEQLKQFIPWIKKLQEMRNEWIHRSIYQSTLVYDSITIGLLPVPKHIEPSSKAFNFPLNKDNFWTTKEFVTYHYKNLINIFETIIERCYAIEHSLFKSITELPEVPKTIEEHLFFFPFILTKKRGRKQTIKIKTPDYWFLGIEKKELAS